MIKITFPDGSQREFEKGTTAYQVAESISPRLAADSLAAAVNGTTVDMTRPIEEDATIKFYKWDDAEGKHAFWHTSSHLLAEALEALYPGIKFGIGPAIENGFYYDVDSPVPITESDLPAIEKKMQELARNKEQMVRTEVSKADALKTFTEKNDQYKVELIRDLEDGTISFYTNGAFTDLCRGPHIPNTGLIKAVKLTSVAGAYWRGNEKNKMLTRVYGISFPKKSMLDEYLVLLEEAKKRDHRKLGKDLELFMFSQRVGQGLPMWLPKGAELRDPNNKEKYIGTDENWEKAESAIIKAAADKGLKTTVVTGEAAFYGPKLDFMVKDALGRNWQLGTIQVDYNLPERFDLTYKGADDKLHRPIMIHRAPFGSMERFVAVLLEHTAGKFPLWLAPDQAVVLPISEKYNDYAAEVVEYLTQHDVRVQMDDRNEKIGRKIRDNELKRIPFLLIVGEKEQNERTVSLRVQGEGDKGSMTLDEFCNHVADLVKEETASRGKI